MNAKSLWKLAAVALCVLLLASTRAEAATAISACQTPITQPGAYVLTGNLVNASGVGGPCLIVNAAHVTIDLAGYTISAATKGQYTGIWANYSDLSVSNGTIQNFYVGIRPPRVGEKLSNLNVVGNTGQGAVLGDDAQVSDCEFSGNGAAGPGLSVGANALIRDSVFESNHADGLDTGTSPSITHSAFNSNTLFGLSAGAGASVTGCVAASNGSHGIVTAGGATLEDDAASSNTGDGFVDSGTLSTYRGNTATENSIGFSVNSATFMGNSASGNSSHGFRDSGFSTYLANTADRNTGDGFHGGSIASTYATNTADNNGGYGFDLVCPDNLIGNTAKQNTTADFTNTGSGCQKLNNLGF